MITAGIDVGAKTIKVVLAKAGKVLADMRRLSVVTAQRPVTRVFVYLTGPEMASYMGNPSNGLAGLFSLPTNETFTIDPGMLAQRSEILRKAVDGEFHALIRLLFRDSLPNSHELRVFGVEPV